MVNLHHLLILLSIVHPVPEKYGEWVLSASSGEDRGISFFHTEFQCFMALEIVSKEHEIDEISCNTKEVFINPNSDPDTIEGETEE